MRIGGAPSAPAAPPRYKSPAEDLFDAISSEYRQASIGTKFSAANALDHGDFSRAPADVRRMFERVAAAFAISDP